MDNLDLTEEERNLLEATLEEAHKEIPVNSDTALITQTTSRFSGAQWYDKVQEQTITLAGVGGIGSTLGYLLSRLRPKNIFLYDPDKVEISNMSGQMYELEDIDRPKVFALANHMKRFADYVGVFTYVQKFTKASTATNIMICGFDNMEARREFFQAWLSHVNNLPEGEKKNCLFIDGRLSLEEFQVFSITGDDYYSIERYNQNYLFYDKDAEREICSLKQTTYCANMIASYMANIFVNFCYNLTDTLISRDIPFLTYYNAEIMLFKTES